MINTPILRKRRKNGEFSQTASKLPILPPTFAKATILMVLALIMTILISSCAMAASSVKLTDKTAVLAIIGEAEAESQTGRIAVAEVIRKRGNLHGIYGINSPRVKAHKYSNNTALLAKSAWFDSRYTNYSHNADGWGNKSDIEKFKRQGWFKNCEIVAVIGNHYFWKKKIKKG